LIGEVIDPNRNASPLSLLMAGLVAGALLCGATAQAQTANTGAGGSTGANFQAPTASAPAPLSGMSTSFQESQNPLFGSVPQGQATAGVITITPLEAIERGLKYNLALMFSQQSNQTAEGARLRALGDVLPNFNGRVGESVQQTNLAAMGLSIPGFPPIIGPFSVFDARVYGTASVDLKNIGSYRQRVQELEASKLNYQNARDLVVLVVGGTYMQALAAEARVNSVQAQLDTANTLLQRAQDMFHAGTVPNIDVLRAQVEQQVEHQRLLSARNSWETQKLTLARMIGLPVAQQFRLVNNIPVTPVAPLTLEQALQRAYAARPDYAAAKAQLQAAEQARIAAGAERLPSLQLNGDYGILGRRPTSSHGTFTAAAGLKIPIFQGGRVRGDELQADALLKRRQDEVADLHGRIEYEIRTAMLDLQSASDEMKVAQSASQLAHEALQQTQDRFRAGVTNNLEVVQAQESVAMTNENLINSTFIYNVAKLSLARSLGVAERAVVDFLGGKP
jgi:outer membrane protein TolC